MERSEVRSAATWIPRARAEMCHKRCGLECSGQTCPALAGLFVPSHSTAACKLSSTPSEPAQDAVLLRSFAGADISHPPRLECRPAGQRRVSGTQGCLLELGTITVGIRAISAHFGPFWVLLGQFGPFGCIFKCFLKQKQKRTILGDFEPFGVTLSHFG